MNYLVMDSARCLSFSLCNFSVTPLSFSISHFLCLLSLAPQHIIFFSSFPSVFKSLPCISSPSSPFLPHLQFHPLSKTLGRFCKFLMLPIDIPEAEKTWINYSSWLHLQTTEVVEVLGSDRGKKIPKCREI